MQTFPYKWNAEQAQREKPSLVIVPDLETKKWLLVAADVAAPIIDKIREAMGPMQIELRKVQYAAFASDETSCFSADIYINGQKAGTAHNEGHGGPTEIEPLELIFTLDAYGATLPKVQSSLEDGSDPSGRFTYQPDAENIIDDLLADHLTLRDLRRNLKKKLMFTRPDGRLYEIRPKKKTAGSVTALLQAAKEGKVAKDAVKILNLLPEAEAFALYRAATN